MSHPAIVAGVRALPAQQKDNLRYHVLVGTPVCSSMRGWYVTAQGAACLAVLAVTKTVPDHALADNEECPGDVSAAYRTMAEAAGGFGAWGKAEKEATDDELAASAEEGIA